jgi:hypothetical protein
MNVVQVLNVKLQRADQSVSWGFNLQGGKDFYSPLLIQKVKMTFLEESPVRLMHTIAASSSLLTPSSTKMLSQAILDSKS